MWLIQLLLNNSKVSNHLLHKVTIYKHNNLTKLKTGLNIALNHININNYNNNIMTTRCKLQHQATHLSSTNMEIR